MSEDKGYKYNGIGFVGFLTALLICLKLTGDIDLNWFLVIFGPTLGVLSLCIIIPVILFIISILGLCIVYGCSSIYEFYIEKIKK